MTRKGEVSMPDDYNDSPIKRVLVYFTSSGDSGYENAAIGSSSNVNFLQA